MPGNAEVRDGPRILTAGLPEALNQALELGMPEAEVHGLRAPPDVSTALREHRWDVMVLGIPADDAADLARAAATAPSSPEVIYCASAAEDGAAAARLLREAGVARVLFEPFHADVLVAEVGQAANVDPAPADAGSSDRLRATLETLTNSFLAQAGAQLETIESAVVDLMEDRLDDDVRRQAHREAHKLAGAAGTYGFMSASEHARQIEDALESGRPLPATEALALSERVLALRGELDAPAPGDAAAADQPGTVPAPLKSPGRILILHTDAPDVAGEVEIEISRRGMIVEVAGTLPEAEAVVSERRPDVLAVHPGDSGDGWMDILAFIDRLGNERPPVQTLMLTDRTALVDRVDAARAGVRGYLTLPIPAERVADAIEGLLERVAGERQCVLALDDDPAMLAALEQLLGPAGMRVETLQDPLRCWEVLESTMPDLLILDVDMPHVNGMELCRTVRHDIRWRALPILFVTSNADPGTVERIFDAGADDYISKPIIPAEFLARVRGRLERSKLARRVSEIDSLTGVANRRRSEDLLGQLLRRARRYSQPVAFSVLDLDEFKKVNDLHGHATGDAVLRRVGELLLRSFRGDDVVGRWGGEEFVVGMSGLDREAGAHRLAEILETLRSERLKTASGSTIRVTFSAGVAEHPGDGEAIAQLYESADAAMYRAKAAGRDRVLAARGPKQPDPSAVDVAVVEDDDAVASLLLHALETRGHRTRWIRDGEEAVRLLGGSAPAVRARVVLLDVNLPGVDGLSVLQQLKTGGSDNQGQVVMLTARAAETEVVRALELGAFDHVAKPFSVPVLMHRLRRAMNA